MVDISDKMKKIVKLIEYGDYFTINRPRQYGKTTVLHMLPTYLPEGYTFIRLSFEGVGETMFSTPHMFCQRFLWQVSNFLELSDTSYATQWQDESVVDFDLLREKITQLTVDKKIVLAIDEVDKTSNNVIFLQFIGMLRNSFLNREEKATFHSVILAGVHDIKNIKWKMMKEEVYNKPHQSGTLYNSPWNIAADFNTDMSFNPTEIASMLTTYEADHNSGMCIQTISQELYKYTSGYPFLVSRLCQIIEDYLDSNWSLEGVQDAVKIITTTELNTLFDDLFKNLHNNPAIYKLMYDILVLGKHNPREPYNPEVEWSRMFGFITVNSNGRIYISNKIFEARLIKYFITAEANDNHLRDENNKATSLDILKDDKFNLELCLRKFAAFFSTVYTNKDDDFYEKYGLLLFIAYLNPLVNGQGFYHVESETSDGRRMDLVLDYRAEQFIIELKLWYGEAAHEKAIDQLLGYLKTKNAHKGYLLTFDLRKEKNKNPKAEWITKDNIQIFNIIV